jgi:hypothetical protein
MKTWYIMIYLSTISYCQGGTCYIVTDSNWISTFSSRSVLSSHRDVDQCIVLIFRTCKHLDWRIWTWSFANNQFACLFWEMLACWPMAWPSFIRFQTYFFPGRQLLWVRNLAGDVWTTQVWISESLMNRPRKSGRTLDVIGICDPNFVRPQKTDNLYFHLFSSLVNKLLGK